MNKSIGLALGSGGGRGLFHLGVLKSLEKNGVKVDYIAGSSIGALIGAMMAAGKNYEQITESLLNNKAKTLFSLVDPTFFKGGMVKGKKLEKLIREWIGVDKFEDLKIPFTAVATDLLTGKEVRISEGDLTQAVRASMSVPMLFEPVEYGEMLLVDGGVTNPVPDDVAKEMGADVVIASNLDYTLHGGGNKNQYKLATNVAFRAFDLYRHHIAEYSINKADIVLNPELEDKGLVGLGSFVFEEQMKATIELGEKMMDEEIKPLLS